MIFYVDFFQSVEYANMTKLTTFVTCSGDFILLDMKYCLNRNGKTLIWLAFDFDML